MIKEIIELFKSDSPMQRAYERSYEMLDLTMQMFKEARETLRLKDDNSLNIDVHNEDHEVNKFTQQARRDVFNHLAIEGIDQLGAGLVLVTIVIDLERIGDLTKDIVDVASEYVKKLDAGRLEEDLKIVEEAIEKNFERTKKSFVEADEEEALAILSEYKWVSGACKDIISQFANGDVEGLDLKAAVALVVYVRSLQRIHSHLRNIASSVVNPFPRIGFKPKKADN